MVARRHRRCFALAALIPVLALAGCGGGMTSSSIESLTREGKVGGMTCVLNLKDAKDPELSWSVTDRVLTNFCGHRVIVEKDQVTLDSVPKKIPSGVNKVTIDLEKDVLSIRADGKPVFGPDAK